MENAILVTILFIVSFIFIINIYFFFNLFFFTKRKQKNKLLKKTKKTNQILSIYNNENENVNFNIAKAIEKLYLLKKGASIIIEQNDSVDGYISNPILIDAIVDDNLIVNIFEGAKSPLHDGAIVISNGRIKYASAYIKILSSEKLNDEFGTRHRSAIGLTEKIDSISIVISEETGKITLSKNGKYEFLSVDQLQLRLAEILNKQNLKK